MIKFGTIGTNWITESFITGALATGKWELAGVFSRNIARSRRIAEKFQVPEEVCFDDMEKMASSGIEAVYIASPNSLHFEQSMFFIERNIHVVCEKPMTVTRSQFERAVETAEKKDVFLIEAYRHINSPGYSTLSEALRDIGPIRNVVFCYNQFSSRYDSFKRGENPNVFNPAFSGGALMDLGVYPISLAVALWGMPEDLTCMAVRLSNGIDATGSILLQYRGFICNITYSKICEGYTDNEILGEDGVIVLDKPSELSRIIVRTKTAPPRELEFPVLSNKLQSEADVFADMIMNRDKAKYKRLTEISGITVGIVDANRQ